jgi:Tfp pilus assembly protein PilN
MKEQKANDVVLGVYVMPGRVEAALLRLAGGQAQIVSHYSRQRTGKSAFTLHGEVGGSVPGLRGADSSDYTLQIGSNGGSSDVTLQFDGPPGSGAFGAAPMPASGGVATRSAATAAQEGPRAEPITTQLREILNEVRGQGYTDVRLAACVASPDVSYHEVRMHRGKDEAVGRVSGALRKRLVEQLKTVHPGQFEADRVGLVPMAPVGDELRYLAIVPESTEPVTPALQMLSTMKGAAYPTEPILTAEVAVYSAIARQLISGESKAEKRRTAIVRVGTDDTVLLFFEGTALQHFDRLRSITSFDSPDTLCSRVMLQQDEQKLGEIHSFVVMTENGADRLVKTFRQYYPSAVVATMTDVFASTRLLQIDADHVPPIPALGAGLRHLYRWDLEAGEPAVNLLPAALLRKRRSIDLAFAWHTVAAMVLFAGVLFYYGQKYVSYQSAIAEKEMEIRNNPLPPLPENPDVLAARLDSLQLVELRHNHALKVLDSLLIGSDRWSRMMEKTTNATGSIPSIWFTRWSPEDNMIRIEGAALSRTSVATLERTLGGRIERLDFSDINDRRVFLFTMTAPVRSEMPRVALYLRDVALGHIQGETAAIMEMDHSLIPYGDAH